ncbi:general vesicular transport factor p115 [Aphis craccivora]|uniref:General vesicular transport factor p115 n=1 Tax=Aphis craccivora TaxID=307492 RepID=A0A6G0YNG4_APHCR|nr:general vesicular transport factor p115 [Aphis craccivora]
MAYQNTQSQMKKVIFHVYNYFKTLAGDKGKPGISNFFLKTREMTAEACGVSLAHVKRVCAEGKKFSMGENRLAAEPSSFKSPRKSYKRAKPMTNLRVDDVDNEVVRKIVHSFYDNGQYPTSAKILGALREQINYSGSQWSVQHILRNLNFK